MAWDGDEVGSLSGVVGLHTGRGVGDRLRDDFSWKPHGGSVERQRPIETHWELIEMEASRLQSTQQPWRPGGPLTNGDGRGGHSRRMRRVGGHRHGDDRVTGHLAVRHRA